MVVFYFSGLAIGAGILILVAMYFYSSRAKNAK